MNQRIRELAEQAGFVDKGNNITAYLNFDHEKFAQLVVMECINIVENHAQEYHQPTWAVELVNDMLEVLK